MPAFKQYQIYDVFQSHLGSIQTIPSSIIFPKVLASFNPTLVRFKLHSKRIKGIYFKVSIPPWFDSNKGKSTAEKAKEKKFQSHLGSIQTVVPTEVAYWTILVSIPPWFDSNLRSYGIGAANRFRFQSHLGSIQTQN